MHIQILKFKFPAIFLLMIKVYFRSSCPSLMIEPDESAHIVSFFWAINFLKGKLEENKGIK